MFVEKHCRDVSITGSGVMGNSQANNKLSSLRSQEVTVSGGEVNKRVAVTELKASRVSGLQWQQSGLRAVVVPS